MWLPVHIPVTTEAQKRLNCRNHKEQIRCKINQRFTESQATGHTHVVSQNSRGKYKEQAKSQKNPGMGHKHCRLTHGHRQNQSWGQKHKENKGWNARLKCYKTIWQIVNELGAADILTRVITDWEQMWLTTGGKLGESYVIMRIHTEIQNKTGTAQETWSPWK